MGHQRSALEPEPNSWRLIQQPYEGLAAKPKQRESWSKSESMGSVQRRWLEICIAEPAGQIIADLFTGCREPAGT
jgi:hypothetical protein